MSTDSVAAATDQFSPSFVRAVVFRGRYVATLVGEVLTKYGNGPGVAQIGDFKLSSTALLDFGALLQLRAWEVQGIQRHVELGLPSFADAFRKFADQLRMQSGSGEPSEFGRLSLQVLKLTMQEFSWDALPTFGFDVPITVGDAEELMDLLAQHLWASRN